VADRCINHFLGMRFSRMNRRSSAMRSCSSRTIRSDTTIVKASTSSIRNRGSETRRIRERIERNGSRMNRSHASITTRSVRGRLRLMNGTAKRAGRKDGRGGESRGNRHGWKSNEAKCKNAKWWELNSHFAGRQRITEKAICKVANGGGGASIKESKRAAPD